MIKINFSKIKKEIWFAKKIYNYFDNILLTEYKQSFIKHVLFKNEEFTTLWIDLEQSLDAIKKNFNKNYKNEINKAIRLNIYGEIETNNENFLILFNKFAKRKKLSLLNKKMFSYYEPYLVITKAVLNQKSLVMHAYLVDEDIKIVRLLYSANSFESEDAKIIGYANKYLHFYDMKFFKEKGFKIYDFGGINLHSTDKEILGINRFKKGFGGKEVRLYNLTSYPLYFLRAMKKCMY